MWSTEARRSHLIESCVHRMRSSVTGRASTALASAFLVLSLGACGAADSSAEEESASGEEQSEQTSDDGASDGGGDVNATAASGTEGDDASAEPSATQASGTTADGECVVNKGSSEFLAGSPEVDEWTMVAGTATPVSAQYGPYVQDGELWTCYERSAAGALFAAAYYASAAGRVEGVYGEWFPEGELRDEVVANEDEYMENDDGSVTMTHIAYRFQTYSADSAMIDLVMETTVPEGTAISGLRVALLWDGDRWVVDLENFGDEAYTVESLDGYSSWRG